MVDEFTLTIGPAHTVNGMGVACHVEIKPSVKMIQEDNGSVITIHPVTLDIPAGEIGTVDLPITGQPGFVDIAGSQLVDWFYTVEVNESINGERAGYNYRKFIQAPVGTVTVDLDLIPEDGASPDIQTGTKIMIAPPGVIIKGDKGDKGDPGQPGPQGPPGNPGAPGTPGAQGIQGVQGVKGDKGDKGDPGAQGVQGNPGATGPIGPTGPTGPVGPPYTPADGEIAQVKVFNLVSDLASKAPLTSPALTGTPTAPTPATTDSTVKLATTAFVQAQKDSPALTGTPTAPTATSTDNSTLLATTAFVQAQKASPTFTGDPKAPTPTTTDNDTSIATTAFVQAQKASPAFTGTPTAPTPASSDNSTTLATTAYTKSQWGTWTAVTLASGWQNEPGHEPLAWRTTPNGIEFSPAMLSRTGSTLAVTPGAAYVITAAVASHPTNVGDCTGVAGIAGSLGACSYRFNTDGTLSFLPYMGAGTIATGGGVGNAIVFPGATFKP